jgi:hypothetical protein
VIARALIGDPRARVIANMSRTEQLMLAKQPGTGFRRSTMS